MKRWPALDLTAAPCEAPPGWEDHLAAALDDLQPSAIQEHDSAWRAFFASAGDRDRAERELRRSGFAWLCVTPVDVDDEDWARRSQEALAPIRVGQIVISPPWAAGRSPGPGVLEILILPSMGFGTGHHASTRLCTALLQRLDLRGRSVLDVGTGSGILAIVASRLGASRVVGIDDDGDAVESARENLALNGGVEVVLQRADFRQLEASPFDVVVANLTGALLVRGADALVGLLAPSGRLIVSGVTAEEENEVVEAFRPGLALTARLAEDGWVGLGFER